MDEGISSPQGLVGKAFEDWLTQKYGGEGAFRVDGRDFDGGQGNRWWEAKSGRYWVDHVRDEISLAKFKSDMGHRLQIAREHSATFEIFSNTSIPAPIKAWLTRKGIPFTELLECVMSHAAGINITLSSSTKSILELIEVFLNNGWSVKDHGHISYLPLGDEDAFNWQHIALTAWPKTVEILKQKEKNCELIGLVMTWKDANTGGEFLFFPDGQRLAVSWSVNRKALKHCADFTDHSWYLTRMLVPLLKEGIVIESVQCYDSA